MKNRSHRRKNGSASELLRGRDKSIDICSSVNFESVKVDCFFSPRSKDMVTSAMKFGFVSFFKKEKAWSCFHRVIERLRKGTLYSPSHTSGGSHTILSSINPPPPVSHLPPLPFPSCWWRRLRCVVDERQSLERIPLGGCWLSGVYFVQVRSELIRWREKVVYLKKGVKAKRGQLWENAEVNLGGPLTVAISKASTTTWSFPLEKITMQFFATFCHCIEAELHFCAWRLLTTVIIKSDCDLPVIPYSTNITWIVLS